MDEQSNKLFCVILHFISAKLHLDPTNRNITKPFYKQQFSTATAGFFQLKHRLFSNLQFSKHLLKRPRN